jgi:1-acyl-sn-glycerol-3-phosphate acyltransferase
LSSVAIGFLINKLLVAGFGIKNLNAEHPENYKRLTKRVNKLATSAVVFFLGYRNIKKENIKVDMSKYKNLKIIDPKDPEHKVTLVVSNHITFMDILFNMSHTYETSFMSKSGVRNFPLIGFYAQCIQCIFVERESKDNRSDAIDKLSQRIKDIQAGKNHSSILLFPEGTTSSGNFITSFKKGAFIHKAPLKVTGVKYFGNMNVALNMMNELEAMMAMIFQWNKSMTYFEIDGLVAPAKEMEWEEYAKDVKKMMCQEFGYRSSESTYRAKKEFEMKYCTFGEDSYH